MITRETLVEVQESGLWTVVCGHFDNGPQSRVDSKLKRNSGFDPIKANFFTEIPPGLNTKQYLPLKEKE